MYRNLHEKLAFIIVDGIMKAEDLKSYQEASRDLIYLGDAHKCAKGNKSRIDSDLRRYLKIDDMAYSEDSIDDVISSLSKKLGRKINFYTIPLFKAIEKELMEKLTITIDSWGIAKLIYSFGLIYDDDKAIISEKVSALENSLQKQLAIICTRIYVSEYDSVFNYFYPGEEIK